ncbi:MAG: tetratricopeptide repeat protein [Thermodesulfobacteria bacterium]|nr:tetratricopeptide repeat protein [Thermodesulfobacteriota bacterium]
MSRLDPLALECLLPLLEESLTPLLPVRVRVTTEREDALPLCQNGEPVAGIRIEDGDLSQEEISRWSVAVRALAQEIFDRLLREKTLAGYPGVGLLTKMLEKGPLSGLLLRLSSPPFPERAFRLAPKTFFLPDGGKDYLLKLWRGGETFVSASIRLESPEEVEESVSLLELAELFGFSWLSGKAARYLAELGLSEDVLTVLKTLRALNRKGHTLVLAEGPAPSLHCLRNKAKTHLFLTEERAFFALEMQPQEAAELLTDLHLRAGLIEGRHGECALVAVWAAFEHARRLAEERTVFFEPYSLHALGDVYFDLGDLGAAKRAYFFALDGTAQPVDLLNSLALVMIQLGDRQAARFFLTQATQEDPNDPLLHYNLALFLEEEGKAEALSHFRRAYKLAPAEPLYAEALAKRLAKEGLWSEIIEILEGKDLGAEGYYLLAKAHYETGNLEKALGLFKKTLDLAPQHRLALAHLALLFIQLKGEYSLAEAVLPEIEDAEGELGELAQDLKILVEGTT